MGGWWTEKSPSPSGTGVDANALANPGGSGDSAKASVVCSAASGVRFVQFVEFDNSTFEEEAEDLSGVFAKVVGPGCARRYSVPASGDVTEALAPLHLWVGGVPAGATVLLAIICVENEFLKAVLSALAPLGVPQEMPPDSSLALSAVCERPQDVDDVTRYASHATCDVAYASLPVVSDSLG